MHTPLGPQLLLASYKAREVNTPTEPMKAG